MLSWIDWGIVVFVLLLMTIPSLYCARYSRSVADFLAADRMAGKYLLTVSQGGTGAVGTIATWQVIQTYGLSTQWWGIMSTPIGLFVRLTGFVTYRFRETRALTLAQFLEMRYSRGFRLFSGTLCWLSGIINYGVFPAVSARAVMTLLGLPQVLGTATVFGKTITFQTFPTIMGAYLFVAVLIACSGGQISLIVSDFLQEAFCKIVLVSITLYFALKYSWPDIFEGMKAASLPGESMFDPFDTSKVKGFNFWFYLIGIYSSIYSVMAWQGNSGYNSAAKTPHLAQMAGILGTWRDLLRVVCNLLPPVVCLVVMRSGLPAFEADAAAINEKLAQIADPQVRNQMVTPTFLYHMLPVGLIGMMAAMFVSGVISVDDTYQHAWGSIFIQDVVMPWRKTPFKPKTHMILLRLAVIGVAVFGFTFSMLFPFKDAILMFFALSGAIYLGGAGITIIGGLYWKRGTTAAAFTALGTGSFLAFGGMLLEQLWTHPGVKLGQKVAEAFPNCAFLVKHADKFPTNGQVIYFIAMVTATLLYIIVSLCGGKVFNLDKMLHRGEYADEETARRAAAKPVGFKETIKRKLGITPNFSIGDKIIYGASLVWSLGWWVIFCIASIIGAALALKGSGLGDAFWSWFWQFKILLSLGVGIVCTFWLTGGGIVDFIDLVKSLRKIRKNDFDDGFVRKEPEK